MAVAIYFFGGYLLINHLSQSRLWFLDVMLPFEKDIPFLPAFIIIYWLTYPLMLALYFVCREDEFKFLAKTLFILMTLHYSFFLLLPVQMTLRPAIASPGFFSYFTNLIYSLDPPANCFPSLHVAFPLTAAMAIKRLRAIYLIAAIAIAFSAVVVKQHYIFDVIASVPASFLAIYLARRFWK